jgi:hypothetical protein
MTDAAPDPGTPAARFRRRPIGGGPLGPDFGRDRLVAPGVTSALNDPPEWPGHGARANASSRREMAGAAHRQRGRAGSAAGRGRQRGGRVQASSRATALTAGGRPRPPGDAPGSRVRALTERRPGRRRRATASEPPPGECGPRECGERAGRPKVPSAAPGGPRRLAAAAPGSQEPEDGHLSARTGRYRRAAIAASIWRRRPGDQDLAPGRPGTGGRPGSPGPGDRRLRRPGAAGLRPATLIAASIQRARRH